MDIVETPLAGLRVITPARFGDGRGFFSESYSQAALSGHGIDVIFVQDNQSLSRSVGTVRGLHFQAPPHAQTKLVRCGRGRFLDVAVDIRVGSPTYGNWFGVELSFENGRQMLVPEGFLHGFVTREADTEIIYKCSDGYSPECEKTVRFDDPAIGIDWGVTRADAVLSDRDGGAGILADLDSPFVYGAAQT